jgi:hypothetical protein
MGGFRAVAAYVARADRIRELAEQRGIEPTAEGLAEAAGLSVRVTRAVLSGHPISNRTWQALARLFGPADGLFVEVGLPKVEQEEAARAAALARFREKLAQLPPETADAIRARAALNSAVELRIARDEARAGGAGAKHAAEFMRGKASSEQRVQ